MYKCSIIRENMYINAALNGVLATLMQYIKEGNLYIALLKLLRIFNNVA